MLCNDKNKFTKTAVFLAPFIIMAIIVLIFFHRVFLDGEVPFPGGFVTGIYHPWIDYKWQGFPLGVPVKHLAMNDVASYIFPVHMFAVKILKEGSVPLWNSLIFAGTPLFANFQSAPFSPTNIVYFLFDELTAWSLQIVLQHVLAAVFTYLLLRSWNVCKTASIFGGIVFAFSGFNMIWSQWNGHTLTASFIPLFLLFFDKYLKVRKMIFGLGIIFTLAVQFFSGYPQLIMYSFIAGLLLWVYRLNEREIIKKTVFVLIFVILSLGISAPQILPGAELLSTSQRVAQKNSFDWIFLPWEKIITFIAVDYFGNPGTDNYWSKKDFYSNEGFVGVVAFVLSLLSLNLLSKKKEVRFSLALAMVSLTLSFPTLVSIVFWKSGMFGMGAVAAHRALVLFNLSVSLMAAHGLEMVLKRKINTKDLLFTFPVFAILLVFFTNAIFLKGEYVAGVDSGQVALRNLVIPATGFMGCLVAVLLSSKYKLLKVVAALGMLVFAVFELFFFGWKYTPFSPKHIVFPKTELFEFFEKQQKPFRLTGNKVIPVNMRMAYGIESLEGYDAVYPVRMAKFLSVLNSSRSDSTPMFQYGLVENDTSNLLDLINTKYYLTIKQGKDGSPNAQGVIPERFIKDRFTKVFEDRTVAVLESKSVLPRAFFVYDFEKISSDDEIFNNLLDPNFSYSTRVIVEEELPYASTKRETANFVNFEIYKEQINVMSVYTEKPGILFISDQWYPGWKAYVDGVNTKIYRANFAFRAIIVPKGEHKVSFIYFPDSFKIGLVISAASLLLVVALFLFDFINAKKHGLRLQKPRS
ncbi:MAG: hypothetical protein A3D24_01725 [Candidatus Blackburnbacteria bacterium RIFCSPHIGHO2_02_FULL_39_13]|uniref:Membrane protein 6-pyruvoyl-tetrahydropterin synthase-related domain-containing protein n=1 Tax=Candidatus Blackburnbacteria bacterium RIFCSPLOWO2_01_FULL_40_20 TaxID=1797519 RepID=A0A1G1VCD9_9BACT|nr:MAG: hypothetical protein UT38_C0005G0019 [Microgenomates group bacterium GW2011_GWA2_39_19]OGY06838.1 MAG: hypothetical protein A2694_00775 [Candidatus Blackburnbacteria bacterium RIFCSPHIGHO2_01_FULL_40_17]OGY07939.1 MAG: hypothetical protein A3D24_01725 [Candidatus Blackburnbacteria bacterium RIFCSPHIGHO2_02_FULL_39_13]OGY12996.1 MAG: hypothetical protein A3A77_01630 [Candidatus Blackburnbacteria bacterium RIFCSPLOWO2_01_FULL_40_20]HBL51765.1 hypothetical protein [Candidatus Blackburnbact